MPEERERCFHILTPVERPCADRFCWYDFFRCEYCESNKASEPLRVDAEQWPKEEPDLQAKNSAAFFCGDKLICQIQDTKEASFVQSKMLAAINSVNNLFLEQKPTKKTLCHPVCTHTRLLWSKSGSPCRPNHTPLYAPCLIGRLRRPIIYFVRCDEKQFPGFVCRWIYNPVSMRLRYVHCYALPSFPTWIDSCAGIL